MKIPCKIRIKKDISYEVVFIPEFPTNSKKFHTYGECRFDDRQIVVAMNQSETEMMQTLIHEIIHALTYENQIEIPHKAVHKLEAAVLRMLRLNKWLK